MLIMLEGLDRTGKTTLGRAIAKRLDCPVIHKAAPTGPWFMEYVAPLAGQPGRDLVLDRWHWGEMVWPYAFDRPARMDLAAFRYVDGVMAQLGAVAVHGTGDPDGLWSLAVADDEPIVRAGRAAFDQAHRRFTKLAGISSLPVLDYEWQRKHVLDDAVDEVLAMAQLAEITASAGELQRLTDVGRVVHPVGWPSRG